MFIKSLIPSIQSKIPVKHKGNIKIQKDNARPHVKDYDPDLVDVLQEDYWGMKIVKKPPKHTDFNCLDLGFLCLSSRHRSK